LFRESDRTLISADAVITVKQDSMYKVLVQKKEVCGPPVYLTTDWNAARRSVETLQSLQPELVIPGHGSAMEGEELAKGLNRLVEEFEELAIPDHGKFVGKKQ
jgi:glyoxylase-like metal-dependent hydrolase (beta-lactamase superfamily II)